MPTKQQKDRRLFAYRKDFAAPTDRYIYPLLKTYHALTKRAIETWSRDLASGRIVERGYLDLADTRMRPVIRDGVITHVLSLVPVIGEETREEMDKIVRFIKLYERIRNALISDMARDFHRFDMGGYERDAPPRETVKLRHFYINLLKLMFAIWDDEKTEVDVDLFDTIFTTKGADQITMSILHTFGHHERVGDAYAELILLDLDDTGVLYQSFARHVRELVMTGQIEVSTKQWR